MNIAAGMLLNPPNLPGWDDFPLRDRVADALGRPVAFQNDANAAAFGESWVGAGRGARSLVLF
jgi:glucokinase